MELYGFVGSPSHDLALYAGKLLDRLDKRVAILDYSEEKELIGCIPALCNELVHYQGNDITTSADFLIREQSSLDIGFVLFSTWYVRQNGEFVAKGLPLIKRSWGFTDFRKKNMTGLGSALDRDDCIHTVVLRDCLGGRMGKNYFQQNFMTESEKPRVFYQLPLEGEDYARRIAMEHEPIKNLKGLSEETRSFLITLVEELSHCPVKEVKRAMRK